ncbi:hypothetical protein N781_00470 [Pontibacillus halophilus JSM 076056 = DSM 19796]|uniref:Uncharacterized protein n=1 Tax=Pontibacillus halophilus JSM 076056 = DSM 19796 TaxID=1385510 RepID=A0A0A5GLB4_9BACI|nr:hypothetical protein [Pontibacillus halophilus]KGX94051.1 hypothetical protein N781_00470 [Pontibacillus halophilus JSM 076056 = DSM 19796]
MTQKNEKEKKCENLAIIQDSGNSNNCINIYSNSKANVKSAVKAEAEQEQEQEIDF